MHQYATARKEILMTGSKHEERWRELCEAIVQEPDSRRLIDLVETLNRILEDREKENMSKNKTVSR
jgi:hypothetical protein